jgi:NADH-quinone oxidoreductase subunit L
MGSSMLLCILVLPLIGFLINFLVLPMAVGGMKNTKATSAGAIATFFISISFILSLIMFFDFKGETISYPVFNWLEFSNYKIDFGLELTNISAIMILIITGIGALIHLYSIGYMHDEVGAARFFAYLNLFCFMMLLLVLSDSLLFTFFGWEGVGLCSFLLIGYWYQNEEYIKNAKKAFVMNRIGDVGFLIGMFILFYQFGSVNYSAIHAGFLKDSMPLALASAAAFFLFVGATGKSAQIPLYTWLPDAMVGPTPVSALIHAATMVTAGVFLCSKLSFIFVAAPAVMTLIAVIGAFTAVVGALIALGQTDIKKVLAYSTVSQLGFMFLAVGVGAFSAAIFHLMTHAFFKALLFLGSGSVIHGCGGEQDMRKMGGLKNKMPKTYITMIIGLMALSGIPFFSGFFSKDEILFYASRHAELGSLLIAMGFFASACTALYSGRLLKLTFFGDYRGKAHVHESPATMLIPLYVLVIFAALGGFLGFSHGLSELTSIHIPNFMSSFLEHSFNYQFEEENISEIVVSAIATVLAGIFFFLGFKMASHNSKPFKLLANKFYIDELYEATIVKPIQKIQAASNNVLEKVLIQNIGCVFSNVAKFVGETGRLTQKSGEINGQLVFVFISITGLVFWFCL